MKQVQIAAYGMPESVAQCVDVEDVENWRWCHERQGRRPCH